MWDPHFRRGLSLRNESFTSVPSDYFPTTSRRGNSSPRQVAGESPDLSLGKRLIVCVQHNAGDRPNMPFVIQMLSGEGALPQPKEPALFMEKELLVADFSSSSYAGGSINDLTITETATTACDTTMANAVAIATATSVVVVKK
nr:G-type lectin S-receptor-like serine/threonine-protein kinase At4g27290 [Tanacetum cinerariifolium]